MCERKAAKKNVFAYVWTWPYKNQVRKMNTSGTIARVIKPVVILQDV